MRALVARGGDPGLRVLSTALAEADDHQADWIEAGVADALGDSEEARAMVLASACRLAQDLPADRMQRLILVLGKAGRI